MYLELVADDDAASRGGIELLEDSHSILRMQSSRWLVVQKA